MISAYLGRINAKKCFDKKAVRWNVYWYDLEGIRHNESYAKWYWETTNGIIPSGYTASYKDENSLNLSPENIVLLSKEEMGNRISKRLMGHGFSDETLKKMSDAKKGKPLSEEHKSNIGKQTKKMWERGVFDDPEIRKVYSNQGKSTKGSKRTEEQKKKMSESHKGMDVSRMFTPEAIEKRRQKLIGKPSSPESNKKRSNTMKGRIFSDEHLEKLSKSGKLREDIRGENCKWWKGGIANDPYPDEFGDYLKRKIRKRDKYLCKSCGENVYGSSRGHVHHIDGNKQNCDPNNLVLLCSTCHGAVHGRNPLTSETILAFRSQLG
jgi:hypothetical protein